MSKLTQSIKRKTANDVIIESICKSLVEKFGTIKDEWLLTLSILEQHLVVRDKVFAQLKKENDMIIKDGHGRYSTHPLLKTLESTNKTILSICQELGATPKALGKLREQTDGDVSEILTNLLT